jgi:putative transferase (TIGR04331 family)
MKVRFFRHLPKSVERKFCYRPYSRGFSTLNDKAYMEKKVPGLNFVDGPLIDKLLECRLVVLDHSGTTLSLAMAADIPLVCFWQPEAWPYNEDGRRALVELESGGVFFDNPELAAKHIENIWDDVQGWWGQPRVIKAVNNWRNSFAKASPNWRVGVLKTLYGLSMLQDKGIKPSRHRNDI